MFIERCHTATAGCSARMRAASIAGSCARSSKANSRSLIHLSTKSAVWWYQSKSTGTSHGCRSSAGNVGSERDAIARCERIGTSSTIDAVASSTVTRRCRTVSQTTASEVAHRDRALERFMSIGFHSLAQISFKVEFGKRASAFELTVQHWPGYSVILRRRLCPLLHHDRTMFTSRIFNEYIGSVL